MYSIFLFERLFMNHFDITWNVARLYLMANKLKNLNDGLLWVCSDLEVNPE